MKRLQLLFSIIAFWLGFLTIQIWQQVIEKMFSDAGAKLQANPNPEELWIGAVYIVGYLLLWFIGKRMTFSFSKLLLIFGGGWLGSNLSMLVLISSVAQKELQRQIAENEHSIPVVDMRLYPYFDWALFGFMSGIFLVFAMLFFQRLLSDKDQSIEE